MGLIKIRAICVFPISVNLRDIFPADLRRRIPIHRNNANNKILIYPN